MAGAHHDTAQNIRKQPATGHSCPSSFSERQITFELAARRRLANARAARYHPPELGGNLLNITHPSGVGGCGDYSRATGNVCSLNSTSTTWVVRFLNTDLSR